MRRLFVLLCTALVASCSTPPQKEIDHAQGALDSARAAGAEQYAAETYRAASSLLQQSHDAVAQRDYRLALAHALDASERAQAAAKEAADGKARARGDGERAAAVLDAGLKELLARVKAAEAARLPAREVRPARDLARTAEAALQETRTMLSVGNYLAAGEAIKGQDDAVRGQIQRLDEALAAKSKSPQRRRR